MKKLALLGSTGSIGTQALDVVRCIQKEGEHAVKVEALAAHSNIRLLEEQIREFKPQAVAVFDLEAASKLRAAIRDLDVKVYSGMEGLCALTELESVDIVLNSVVGMVGLKPTLTALEAKKQMALANKETLVAGGSLVMKTAKENGIEILPVDSEHSAIFQCLQGMYKKCDLNNLNGVRRSVLRQKSRGASAYPPCRRLKAPELGHGREGYHRQLHAYE